MTTSLPKALAFDVFGTVVDWRTAIIREARDFLRAIVHEKIDPARFADGWRARYSPAMEAVRSGRRPFVVLDVLQRETLEDLLSSFGIAPATIDEARLADLTLAWHRLDPWPDSAPGLTRLKTRFPIVTLSNGNIALMLDLARRGGLPWDAILGAEFSRTYKPDSEAYLATARALAIEPSELCLVAAHHSDLAAARGCGLQTAFVHRPAEQPALPSSDAEASQNWDYTTDSLTKLADTLGC